MLNIQEPATQNQKKWNKIPILELPFRAFFLLAAVTSIYSLVIWSLFLQGHYQFNTTGIAPTLWHAHEMIFGFAATVAVAFILTAGKTWTGQSSLSGLPLLGFILLWVVSRTLLLMNNEITVHLALITQTIWWLTAIFVFIKMVVKAENRRNYIFVLFLSVLMTMNIAVLIAGVNDQIDLALHLSRACVLVFTLLISLLGGRVIPFFTARATQQESKKTPTFLNVTLVITALIGITIFIFDYFIALPITPAFPFVIVGLLHLARLTFWRSASTLSIPLLWSLHLSYFCMATGLLWVGLSYFTPNILFSDALHLITVGTIGLMTFAMMSRVSLGHTGRPLVSSWVVTVTFYGFLLAALLRVTLPIILGNPQLAWQTSAIAWVVSASLFLIIYTPILCSKRADQK